MSEPLHEKFRPIGVPLTPATLGWRGLCVRAASLILPFGLFVFIAFGDFPTAIALEVHYKNPVILLGLGLFLYFALCVEGWTGIVFGMAAVLSVFAVELVGFWLAVESDGEFVIGGLLPWSDAQGYYAGAQFLDAGARLAPWYGRRPWFIGELAILLEITNGNLQWAIAVLAAITATACFLLAKSIQALLGTAAAVAALLVLQLFYSRFIGTTLTEHLGLSLGSLALAVLVQGAQRNKLGIPWAMGLGLLTFALVARAGAFFILPVLLAWGTWLCWRRKSKQDSINTLALGSAAVGIGFILDVLLRRTLVPGAVAFGNFSHTLYGLVTGNKGWMQARLDHPEILNMGDAEASRHVYELAFTILRDNPLSVISGVIGTWQDFFSYGVLGAFGFISMPQVQWAAIILGGLGLAVSLWRWRSAYHSMVLVMVAGVVLSVPFVPPIDAYSMRVFAATLPIWALLVAHGTTLFRFVRASLEKHPHDMLGISSGALGTLLVLVIFFGAIALSLSRQPLPFQVAPCSASEIGLVVRVTRGSSIQLVADHALAQSRTPYVRISDFKASVLAYRRWYPDLFRVLESLDSGQTLRFTVNLAADRYGQGLWLITDSEGLPQSGVVHACAVQVDSEAGNFYRVRTLKLAAGSNS